MYLPGGIPGWFTSGALGVWIVNGYALYGFAVWGIIIKKDDEGNMMDFLEFVAKVEVEVQDRLGKECSIEIHKVYKNNGIKHTGLIICPKEEALSPVIYLEPFYEIYVDDDGESSFDNAVTEIIDCYLSGNCHMDEINPGAIADFEQMNEKIMFKLINGEENKELLQDIPHMPYFDLAVVFYLLLRIDERNQVSALIHNEHMEAWRTDVEELYRLASINTPKTLPATLRNMSEVMKEILGLLEGLGLDESDETMPLYVLANQTGLNGAIAVLYPDILKRFSEEKQADLILLPSSLHEMLIVLDDEEMEYEHLQQMVESINEAEVPRADRLSNNIYRFSQESGEIDII